MKISSQQPPRAFAVIMVLVAITVLSILAGALAIFMKVESQLAKNSNDSEDLLWIGRAGVERACWLLAQEPPGPTSLLQKWAGGPGTDQETNGPLADISLTGFQVGDGTVDIDMVEQESKFNINTADSQLLQQVLTTMGVDASKISVVSDSIQDWVDPDDATKPAGAESDFYQGLNPPYYAKNAPIDDLQELQYINGITEDMFNGTGPPDPNAPYQHHQLGFGHSPGQAPEYPFGLRDVFTPYSNGKVNINTAGSNVLASIPGMDANSAEGILTLRSSAGGEIGDGIIRSFNQLTPVLPGPAALQQIQRYCILAGNTYEVHVTAHVGSNSREFMAVILRYGNRAQVVSFYPK